MLDFDIRRTTRRCTATDRQLQPGEVFYSVLMRDGDQFLRHDYCAQAWSGPPEGCVGWWQCQIPKIDAGRVFWAPNDVLISYFEQLVQSPELAPTCYVMTLLLIRRRLLENVGSRSEGEDQEILEVRLRKGEQTFQIRVVQLEESQIRAIQSELAEQLFTNQPPAGE